MKRKLYEAKINGSWHEVTFYIFRSWGGERRVNGEPYTGTTFYLGSKRPARQPKPPRDAATTSWLRKNGMIKT